MKARRVTVIYSTVSQMSEGGRKKFIERQRRKQLRRSEWMHAWTFVVLLISDCGDAVRDSEKFL
jgi:hypothetical protein